MTRRALVVAMCVLPALAQRTAAADRLPIRIAIPIAVFVAVVGDDEKKALGALARIDKEWHPSSAAPLIELLHFVQSRRVLGQVVALIEKVTGRLMSGGVDGWYEWLWSQERPAHPDYAQFKALLYASIDARFVEYFERRPKTSIRLDEIRWGGVRRDGIPPLKNPAMIAAADASWLHDGDIVFGVAINGDVRAYPKRILAWHEMFKDRIGGLELAGVYCTLCGALVLYDVVHQGVQHELGTSGFLYRSNKLMYDHATHSMWSTLTGMPVVGALVGKGIELKSLYLVTTTWKEWRQRHPGTQVLSLETGYQRNYSEGAAYRDYFATDKLMFTVPALDPRLPNKAEVLALRFGQAGGQPLAVAADFLASRPVYQGRVGAIEFVVLTDASGANRVYESQGTSFVDWDQLAMARDSGGTHWKVDEAALTSSTGTTLKRLPAHRAFWFGWHAAFPNTGLVK